MSGYRLDDGGLINRDNPLTFTFDGKEYTGFEGDSLASALIANGVDVVGRGFKYHRPRGVMSAGVEEGGALLTVGGGRFREPNTKAPVQPLFGGLVATAQNAWPSVQMDVGRINDVMKRFLAAGFYYKTFFGVRGGTKDWMLFEKIIRKAAGMGRASREPDPDSYETAHAACDVLVVGSGPAGLAAAKAASDAGKDVILAEQDFVLGGSYLSRPGGIDEAVGAIDALRIAGVTIMPRTCVFGLYDSGVAGLIEQVSDDPGLHGVRQRTWIVRPREIVLATGAIEQPLAFGNNDRPGVMQAGAVRTYLNRYAVAPGKRAVVATTNDSAYAVAADLVAAGVGVTLIDAREIGPDAPDGVKVMRGMVPIRTKGNYVLKGVEIGTLDDEGYAAAHDTLDCDLLAVSGGWTPAVHLTSHRGPKPVWNDTIHGFLAGTTNEAIRTCGAAAGVYDHDGCIASGEAVAQGEAGPQPEEGANPAMPLYEVKSRGKKLKCFIDPQHDVTTDDVRLAEREGFVSIEHNKRYTTLGMATDQGKVGNVIGIAIMADASGRTISETGTTTFRPPYSPISIGALAGRGTYMHFRPVRRTPLHDWNLAQGAVMTDAGLWKRPWYFPTDGESMDDAYIREMKAVRSTVGLCDVSTLGKIMVQGPDAGEFLNRVYVNGFGKLAIGKARYGVMLRDDGIVYDDGTVWRMSETDFLMTTTTANAAGVMAKLEEFLQTRWPDLKVQLTSVSDQWAGIAVAGPKCREVLQAVTTECDLSDEAFPFMGIREARIAEADVWIARISFSGERAFEVYVRGGSANAVMDALWDTARPIGGVLYGTEALGALRIEKGHVAGSELDGRTSLDDLGLGGMASSKKAFIGKAMSEREGMRDPDRLQLVGIAPVDSDKRLRAGALLDSRSDMVDQGEGFITAVTDSPDLGHWIGLALVKGGLKRWEGKEMISFDPARDGNTAVRVMSPHFFDPKGERMHG